MKIRPILAMAFLLFLDPFPGGNVVSIALGQNLEPPLCPSQASLSGLISDPWSWIRRCMGDPCKGETELAGKVLEFQADMDHDGLPELFIASPCTYGNAGADFFVFRKNGNHYRYLGSLFLHPKAFKVLSMDADHLPKVILYRRHGCCQGSLVTVKHTGSGFTVVEEETIFPQDRDRERYRQIFSE